MSHKHFCKNFDRSLIGLTGGNSADDIGVLSSECSWVRGPVRRRENGVAFSLQSGGLVLQPNLSFRYSVIPCLLLLLCPLHHFCPQTSSSVGQLKPELLKQNGKELVCQEKQLKYKCCSSISSRKARLEKTGVHLIDSCSVST